MIPRRLERRRAKTIGQDIRYIPTFPPPVRDDHNEEVLHWVLDQGGGGVGLLVVVIAGVEDVAVDIAMKGIQSVVNETADEENK